MMLISRKHFFIHPTYEDICFGWYPLYGFCLRWKSAEDGRTWMRPTLTRIHYGKLRGRR